MNGTFQEIGASTVAPPKEDTGYPEGSSRGADLYVTGAYATT